MRTEEHSLNLIKNIYPENHIAHILNGGRLNVFALKKGKDVYSHHSYSHGTISSSQWSKSWKGKKKACTRKEDVFADDMNAHVKNHQGIYKYTFKLISGFSKDTR